MKVQLLRHAQAFHHWWYEKHQPTEVEIERIVSEEKFKDPGLTPHGIQQILSESKVILSKAPGKIDVVFVSPLKRAIQTCFYLFMKEDPSEWPRVFVTHNVDEIEKAAPIYNQVIGPTLSEDLDLLAFPMHATLDYTWEGGPHPEKGLANFYQMLKEFPDQQVLVISHRNFCKAISGKILQPGESCVCTIV